MSRRYLCPSACLFLTLALVACSGVVSPPLPPLTSPAPLKNAPTPLVTPTYDGSGQTVEPTVLYFPNGWQGYQYWMAVSPYPYEDERLENPSILVSHDGQNWSVPPGLTNPIVSPTKGTTLADATVVYDDVSNQLWVYYLHDMHQGPAQSYRGSLMRTTSADGIHWSTPQVVISGANVILNSPSVGKVGNQFILWVVDTGTGCTTQTGTVNLRTSPDGVNWSAPHALNINQPGYVIWHLNTVFVPGRNQFMSLLAAYPIGSNCGHTSLFFANSYDGINWQTYPQILLGPSHEGWDSVEIYRSSLIYDPANALVRVWYSAQNKADLAWHVGYTQGPFPVPPSPASGSDAN
jgi:hypothetical protein